MSSSFRVKLPKKDLSVAGGDRVISSKRVEPIAERDNVTFQEILSRNQEALSHFLSEDCT
jgi:hypothetical protein